MAAPYADRADAGRQLAGPLRAALGPTRDLLLLGLPRGGVPVAAAVQAELGGELDVLVVRKVGVPGSPELAMGAVATGGVRVVVEAVLSRTRLAPERVERAFRDAEAELRAREAPWRASAPAPVLTARDVVLVDDGLATGATMRAAVAAARASSPARVVVAAPVGARSAVEALRQVADAVICPLVPPAFRAVGLHYRDFTQTSTDEVRALLQRVRAAPDAPEPPAT